MKSLIKSLVPDAMIPFARQAWNALDLLIPRKNRSYPHGLLFDLNGGKYETEGMSFEIDRQQFPRSYRSRLYFDIYERAERDLARKWISPEASVLELGGCIGVLSCVVNRLLENPRNHVVIEANPTLIDLLRNNRDRNDCQFDVENCVVSEDSECYFFISGLMTANRTDSERGEKISVPTKTYQELLDKHQKEFDTLILDIEGGEFPFLVENQRHLKKTNLVMLELHRNILSSEKVDQCEKILEAAGLTKVDSMDETNVWLRKS